METEKLKRQWEKQDEAEIEAAINTLYETAPGRRFLWWLLQIGRIGSQPFMNNSLTMAFNCGELNVGQRILDRLVSVSPDGYVDMMKEQQNERNERNDLLSAASDRDRAWDVHQSGDGSDAGAE